MRIQMLAALALLTLSFTPTIHGQTITRVTPQAAAQGDVLIINGVGLSGVTAVRFFAEVGGFLTTLTKNEVPLSVTATEVRVNVATMSAFVPPHAFQPGSPYGTVRLVSGAQVGPPVSFFYMEAIPGLTTLGAGTTQSTGDGRAVTSFVVANGQPAPGNAAFTLTLENAAPGQLALLAIGLPSGGPFIPFGNGEFVVDVSLPFLLLQVGSVNTQGDAVFAAPLPAPLGVSVAFQWAFLDPNTGNYDVAKAMRAAL